MEQNKNVVREVVNAERIRRITGYLTGTVDRFNNAKFAEMTDRTINCGRIGFQRDSVLKHKNEIENQKIEAALTAEK